MPDEPATDHAGVPDPVAVALVFAEHFSARLRLVWRLEANDLDALASEGDEFIADLDWLTGRRIDQFPLPGHLHAFIRARYLVGSPAFFTTLVL